MYWGAVILVVVALRQSRTAGFTYRRLQELFGVTRPTLDRWRRYFREVFPLTRAWITLSSRLWPPVRPDAPGELIDRFVQSRGDPETGLLYCLQTLCAEPR